MGYYVTGKGSISFDVDKEEALVKVLKDLNHQHHLKTGGTWPKTGDPYKDSWFAWMPAKYHEDENLNSVVKILEMLGFSCEEKATPTVKFVDVYYDNKTGAEQIFIEALAKSGAFVNIVWEGEEGERWHVSVIDGKPVVRDSRSTWTEWREADSVVNYRNLMSRLVEELTNEHS